MPTSRVISTISFFALLVLPLACSGVGSQQAAFDAASLERVEDLSESLANDLLKLSVAIRDRDWEAAAEFVGETVDASILPESRPELRTVARWIRRCDWPLDSKGSLEHDAFLEQWRTFFGRFDEIEDARLKVKAAEFDPGAEELGKAKLKFFVVGRDENGQREWLRGKASIAAARQPDASWRVGKFVIDSLESTVTDVDLFSEVAFPAGVSAVFPAFGVGANQGFVSHGAATADVDGDGLLDIAASGVDQNYLYLNAGDGTFRDVSVESLVKFAPIGSGALFVDYDNDGDPDLFFAAVGRQILLENRRIPDGELRFWDVSEKAGVDKDAVGFSVVAADVNNDGHTDVYVCSYNRYGTVMPNSWHRATNGTPNLLFLNRGDGTFEEQAAAWGVDDGRWTYAAGFVDIDADGDQDLYVANDFGENALYRNDGDRFVDDAGRVGVVDPGFGMGVAFGDYDNDGDLDLHVTNMSSTAGNRILKLLYPEDHEIRKTLSKQAAGNSLYANQGDGTFRDVTEAIGGLAGGWAFGGGFVDFDNDGWEDLYTPNGFISGKTMDDT